MNLLEFHFWSLWNLFSPWELIWNHQYCDRLSVCRMVLWWLVVLISSRGRITEGVLHSIHRCFPKNEKLSCPSIPEFTCMFLFIPTCSSNILYSKRLPALVLKQLTSVIDISKRFPWSHLSFQTRPSHVAQDVLKFIILPPQPVRLQVWSTRTIMVLSLLLSCSQNPYLPIKESHLNSTQWYTLADGLLFVPQ